MRYTVKNSKRHMWILLRLSFERKISLRLFTILHLAKDLEVRFLLLKVKSRIFFPIFIVLMEDILNLFRICGFPIIECFFIIALMEDYSNYLQVGSFPSIHSSSSFRLNSAIKASLSQTSLLRYCFYFLFT
jgi:hypothetical protein